MTQEFVNSEIQKYITSFDEADTDNSGTLTLREAMKVFRKNGFKGTYSGMIRLFSSCDENEDSVVSREEFNKAVGKLTPNALSEYFMRKMFNDLDKDNSGYITKSELAEITGTDAVKAMGPQKMNELVAGVEGDADGKVHYEEFLKIVGLESAESSWEQVFHTMDADGNGILEKAELEAAVDKDPNLFQYTDSMKAIATEMNKDKMTLEEFKAIWGKIKEAELQKK